MSRKQLPKYALHKASGQARVRLNGKDIYLGVYGSAASHERYAKLVDDWLKSPTRRPSELTIGQLTLAYMEFAKRHYCKDGLPTSQIYSVRLALRPLNRLFSDTSAAEFSPRMLRAVREEMLNVGYVRISINEPDQTQIAIAAAQVARGSKSLFFCQSRATTEAKRSRTDRMQFCAI